jgi:fatty acid desaturase
MLAAHRFASDGRPRDHLGQFADSIDTPAGWWAALWAPLGMRYHALHHLFPTLPFHNLRPAYRRLVASLPVESFYHRSRGEGLVWAIGRLLGRSRNVEVTSGRRALQTASDDRMPTQNQRILI